MDDVVSPGLYQIHIGLHVCINVQIDLPSHIGC